MQAGNGNGKHANQPRNAAQGNRARLFRPPRAASSGSLMAEALLLKSYFRRLEQFSTLRWTGRVTKAVGHLVESDGPFCSVGEGCAILTEDGRVFSGEIIGFRGRTVLSMPLERPSGIRYGDRIVTRGTRPSIPVGPGLLGRVVDGASRPLDDKGPYRTRESWPLFTEAPL